MKLKDIIQIITESKPQIYMPIATEYIDSLAQNDQYTTTITCLIVAESKKNCSAITSYLISQKFDFFKECKASHNQTTTPFIAACMTYGKAEAAHKILSHAINTYASDIITLAEKINLTDSHGKNALHWASLGQFPTYFIQNLINANIRINLKDLSNKTPLDYALLKGDVRVITILENASATYAGSTISPRNSDEADDWMIQAINDRKYKSAAFFAKDATKFDFQDSGGVSLLMKVAGDQEAINPSILRILIGKTANIDLTDNYGKTALFHAITANNFGAIRYLIEGKANTNSTLLNGTTPIIFAAKYNPDYEKAKIISYLAQHHGDPYARDISNKTCLDYLISNKARVDTIFYVIKHCFGKNIIDLNSSKGYPIVLDLLEFKLQLFKKLVQDKLINVTHTYKDGSSLLYWALHTKLKLAVEILTDTKLASWDNSHYDYILKKSISDGNLEILNYIFSKKDIFPGPSIPPTHLAAALNKVDVLNSLIGIDYFRTEIKDENNCTALSVAIKNNSEECALFLLSRNAAVHCTDSHGISPLMYALGFDIDALGFIISTDRVSEKVVAKILNSRVIRKEDIEYMYIISSATIQKHLIENENLSEYNKKVVEEFTADKLRMESAINELLASPLPFQDDGFDLGLDVPSGIFSEGTDLDDILSITVSSEVKEAEARSTLDEKTLERLSPILIQQMPEGTLDNMSFSPRLFGSFFDEIDLETASPKSKKARTYKDEIDDVTISMTKDSLDLSGKFILDDYN